MEQLIEYLIKLSGTLMVLYLFYWMVLQRLTFYTSNRWYLLGYSIVAFLIPLIDISPVLKQAQLMNSELVHWVPVVEMGRGEAELSFSHSNPWGITNLVLLFFCVGIVVMLVRFFIQYFSVRSVRRGSQLISNGEVKLYHTDKNIIPFSFGNSIFINQHKHSEKDLREIVRHEFIHVKQNHTVDILWSEWLCILNWYNPFAWLMRSAIRQNLEFIADKQVLENGIDKKEYQYLLLKVMGAQQSGIIANFNFTSLKKRIAMMNKTRSAKVHFIKFLFVLPLIAFMLLAFRKQVSMQDTNTDTFSGTMVLSDHLPIDKSVPDTVPSPPVPPGAPKPAFVVKPNSKGYIITIADNHDECVVIIKNKEHKIIKALTLVEWNENEKEYRSEYGEIPPPPPASPVLVPIAPAAPKLPAEIAAIDVTNRNVTISFKNGHTENYNLNNPEHKAAFEKKYGKVPASPHNPNSNTNTPNYPNSPIIIDRKEDRNYLNPEGLQKDSTPRTRIRKQDFKDDNAVKITLKTINDFHGLIIVNDKEYSKESLENEVKLDVNNIQSVEVIKDEKALQLYGEKGKNGVIRIVTKIKSD